MIIDRLRGLLGRDDTDEENYRCINCGEEYAQPYEECSGCGGSFVAPIHDEKQNS